MIFISSFLLFYIHYALVGLVAGRLYTLHSTYSDWCEKGLCCVIAGAALDEACAPPTRADHGAPEELGQRRIPFRTW